MATWIDWLILAVLVYHIISGWKSGFIMFVSSALAFAGSLWIFQAMERPVSDLLTEANVSVVWVLPAVYLLIILLGQWMLSMLFGVIFRRLPERFNDSVYNRLGGSIGNLFYGLLLVCFFLVIIQALPIRGPVKPTVDKSWTANQLIWLANRVGGDWANSLISEVKQTSQMMQSLLPGSSVQVDISGLPVTDLKEEPQTEEELLLLINRERLDHDVPVLLSDAELRVLARAHSRDMLERKYFSHVDPDGADVVTRLEKADFVFTVAAENLAFAPDAPTAHSGLMQSENHRKNILDPHLRRLGIGVIDVPGYGKMITQDFTD